MSYYSKEQFEYHFALRTLYNLRHIDEEVKQFKAEGKKEDDYKLYEVTQLINSFVGFLILPKENAFFYLEEGNIHFPWGSKAEGILKKINKNKESTKNTYLINIGKNEYRKKSTSEDLFTEADLIRHLRNAIAHTNFSVYPKKYRKGQEIRSLIFEDSYDLIGKFDGNGIFRTDGTKEMTLHQEFSLVLTIEEVKVLLLSMCKVLLDNYPTKDNKKTNWPDDLKAYIDEM